MCGKWVEYGTCACVLSMYACVCPSDVALGVIGWLRSVTVTSTGHLVHYRTFLLLHNNS